MSLYSTDDRSALGFAFLFHKCNIVSNTELVFKVMTTSAADQSSASHDTDSIAEVVSFVHEMGC